ncbi:MAG: SsrA-binding protein SmpB [Bacteriovoracaceae bacterium]|nr:SsrA-binding protein SmpB [Bacteriovoracaceae bacterium]
MTGIKIIAQNKRAGFDFFLIEFYEAGIALTGTEIKSLRNGKVSLSDAFITIDSKGQAWVQNMGIPPYSHGNIANHIEKRKRKLLLNKKEIVALENAMARDGLTVVPTKIYFKSSLVKLGIATAKGKKKYDKREDTKTKEVERNLRRKDFT